MKIPNFTQGDRVEFEFTDNFEVDEQNHVFDPNLDSLKLFIRGASTLNAEAIYDGKLKFVLESSETENLEPGTYKGQFVLNIGEITTKKTLGISTFEVCPSFENLESLDTRLPEEKELEILNEAIAKLSSGVHRYEIHEREMEYSDLPDLIKQRDKLRNRIAKLKNPNTVGGRNVGVRFCR